MHGICLGGTVERVKPPEPLRGLPARMKHQLRRETPREAGWDKADEGPREGCMGAYGPNRNSNPTETNGDERRRTESNAVPACLAAVAADGW